MQDVCRPAGSAARWSALSTPRELALREGLRVWAEIDLDRLAANVKALAARAGDARLLAVVKANAFGHGAVPAGRAAIEAGAWGLGVIAVEEGEDLRAGGIEAPILVLGSMSPLLARRAVAADLRTTVGSVDVARALSRAAAELGREARVHVKLETGLNRYGLRLDAATALAEEARDLPGVVVEGLSTHLAAVDEGDKSFTNAQFELFRRGAQRLSWIPMHHVSSTGALLDRPEMRLAMVRSGIGLYGYYPSDEVQRSVPLSPVMALRTRVARVATVEAGESVGYARTWVAKRRSSIATVMAGYGDGVRRALSSRGAALVRGRRAPFAGRVAMDMLMLDVTDIDSVAVEDEVTLIGEQGGEAIGADEVAKSAGTIAYEIVTGVMARVPRLYVRGGRIVGRDNGRGYSDLE